MTLTQLSLAALALFLASILQGAIGFAYTLFALPILIWLDIPLPQAVTLVTMSVAFQLATGSYCLRHHIKWPLVLYGTAIRYMTIPIGVLLLHSLGHLDTASVKQIVGGILLLVLLAHLYFRVEPKVQLASIWGILAFLSSGLMGGMVAMGGPPVVLWAIAHQWSSQEIRAFLFTLFLLGTPLIVTLLYLTFGQTILWIMIWALLFSPLVALGSRLGVWVGNQLSRQVLQRVTYAVLFIIGLVSLSSPLLTKHLA